MAGRIPEQFIDELVNRVDIVDLINSRVPLKKAGKEYQACCPFHDEKTPSFTVSREKQFYHCFGCGAHGTAIGFLMKYDNMGFVEAVEELATQLGLEIPREAGERSGPDFRPLYETLEKAARYYQWQLRKHPNAEQAVDYLKQRGLSGEIASEFGIGYAPPGWNNLDSELGRNSEQTQRLLTTGMLTHPEDRKEPYDRFRERIMFPIRNHRGQVIAFGGRILGDGKPKYLNSPETPVFHKGRELYGLYEARKHLRKIDRLLVVEGYMDVVALAQFGIRYAVATLGTTTTPEHLERLYRTCPEVVFCFDGDRAGRDAARKALETTLPFIRDGREARFLFLPEGEDPDTLIRKEGSESFEARVNSATPLSDFLFDHLAQQVDMGALEGRAQLAELAKPMLQKLPDGVFREMMFKRLGQQVGLEMPAPKYPSKTTGRPKPKQASRSYLGTMPPVRRAIALVISNPRLGQQENLPEQWKHSSLPGITLLKELLELVQSQPNLSTAAILERWREREEGRHLQKLAGVLIDLPEEDQARELSDTLQTLSNQYLDQEAELLLQKAAEKGLSGLTLSEKERLNQALAEKAQRKTGQTEVDENE
ncbi:DNA primase [Solemya velesiana gill symbiont]|uniref:DNA primase n=1 Tax=Solemya velesiana gill symbiont TaxID=1918948 RepID=A0A1T2KWJ7_9GAMM|nr:DNA primase [Solemya velesiana gill symbiont]OOZ37215.1 DNA primase [Solemya velesiana gill symbiont]